MTSNSDEQANQVPSRLARHALLVGCGALRPHASKYSPRRYTQPQLFACLALKAFHKTDYRGIQALLRDHADLRATLGLRAVPHFTTLHKASRRLLRRPKARRLFGATARHMPGAVATRASFAGRVLRRLPRRGELSREDTVPVRET